MTDRRDESFRAYVVASRGRLLRTATLLASGDSSFADDLVQTALMRLYVAWPRVRTDTIDVYTRKAMLNALIDDRRRPFRRRERTEARVPDVSYLDERDDPGEAAAFRALAALPPRMRAAVVLRHLDQLSVAETAAALRCSEGTVKSQTARGLAELRTALNAAGPSPPASPSDRGLRADREHSHDRNRTHELPRTP